MEGRKTGLQEANEWVRVREREGAARNKCQRQRTSISGSESCPSWPSDHLCNEFFGGHKKGKAATPAEAAAEATRRCIDGKPAKRWPNALAIVAGVAPVASSVEKLQLGSQPHFKLANRCDTVAGYSCHKATAGCM